MRRMALVKIREILDGRCEGKVSKKTLPSLKNKNTGEKKECKLL